MNLTLTGWKAGLAIVLILGFVAFKLAIQTEALDSQGAEEVRKWLAQEAMRSALPEMRKAMEDPHRNARHLEELARGLQKDNFEVVSLTRHGSGDRIVARVEIRYRGDPPPHRPEVRYFGMEHSMLTGWRVRRETSKWSYYLTVF